jgi:hypothetical protein
MALTSPSGKKFTAKSKYDPKRKKTKLEPEERTRLPGDVERGWGTRVESREEFDTRKAQEKADFIGPTQENKPTSQPTQPVADPVAEQSVAQSLGQGDLMGALRTLLKKESMFERGIGTAGTFEEGQPLDPLSTVGEIGLASSGAVGSGGATSAGLKGSQAIDEAARLADDALRVAQQQADELNKLAETALKSSDALISFEQAKFKILSNRQAMDLLFSDLDLKGAAIARGEATFGKVVNSAQGIVKPGEALVDVFRGGKWVKEVPNTKEAKLAQSLLSKTLSAITPNHLLLGTAGVVSAYMFTVPFQFNVRQDTLMSLRIELGKAEEVGDIDSANKINERIQSVSNFSLWDGIKAVAGPLGLVAEFVENSIILAQTGNETIERMEDEAVKTAEATAKAEELASLSIEEAIAMVDAGDVTLFDLPDTIQSTVRAQISNREFEAAQSDTESAAARDNRITEAEFEQNK